MTKKLNTKQELKQQMKNYCKHEENPSKKTNGLKDIYLKCQMQQERGTHQQVQ